MPTPEVRRGIPTVVKGAIAAGVLATAGLGAAVGLGAFNRNESKPVTTPTPSAAAASPTLATKTNTPASPDVSPSQSPSTSPSIKPNVEPVDCQVISKDLCAQAEYAVLKDTTFVGLNLPPGTNLLSPIDGRQTTVKIAQPNSVQGYRLSISPEDNSFAYSFIGDIQSEDKFIQAGKVSGLIGNSGLKNYGYDLIITINRFNPTTKASHVDIDMLRKLFPKAFEKAPRIVTYNGQSSVTVESPVYYNKP